jgi:hypothetical protein
MFGKLKEKASKMYHRIRCYLDDEVYLTPEERVASDSDKFALTLEELLTRVIYRERFTYKYGKVLLPTIYHVVLSEPDASEWPGIKRSGLEARLRNHIYREIRSIATECTFMSHKYDLTIGVGNDLEKGEFRVVSQWENAAAPIELRIRGAETTSSIVRAGNSFLLSTKDRTSMDDKTDEETVVRRTRAGPFLLEIRRDGVFQRLASIEDREISAGRGSYKTPVDILLTGDPEISRLHLLLRRTETGDLKITVKGRKPVFVRGRALESGDTVFVQYNDFIQIGTYTLRVTKKRLANEYAAVSKNTHQILGNIS